MKKHEILIDKEKCIGCGMCERDCVAHNIALEDKKANAIANDCVMWVIALQSVQRKQYLFLVMKQKQLLRNRIRF